MTPRQTTLFPLHPEAEVEEQQAPAEPKTDIPQVTYRFQFHKDFTFSDAEKIIPYLSALGVTHCYASPLLKAQPGSMHGYDIVDHTQLNPEIGTPEAFDSFCETLKKNNLHLIVDIVPNHMGIGEDNVWWMDVLENGPSSEFAHYFDIDWTPVKPELRGKVLLPVLGEQYGKVLEAGEFRISFMPENGAFRLHYYEHYWPLNPNSYTAILKSQLEILETRLGKDDLDFLEYQSIITGFDNLPTTLRLAPDAQETRKRERVVHQKRLSELCIRNQAVTEHIQNSLESFNQVTGNSECLEKLHAVLEMQAYRLAFWRVASDEINYRRFFDINELAGLNMQHGAVFAHTHQLLLQWVKDGKVTGFRIDHPDGLYDPAAYFNQLQTSVLPEGKTLAEKSEDWPLYVVAEKILAPHESIPDDWKIHGTSGYDFGNRVMGLFVPQSAETAFTNLYNQFANQNTTITQQIYECKKLILKESLSSELNVLANKLYQLSEQDWSTRDFTLNNFRRALAEIIASFPVYRTYITPNNIGKKDKDYIQWAVQLAKKYSPLVDTTIFDFIHRLLILDFDSNKDIYYIQAATHFALKFQQLSGPIMAKGLEDTFFYRYNRLIALNEVGGEPQHFGLSINAFHRQTQDQAKSFPHTMLTTSTHDSKRSEDVRSRLCVLAEMPEEWEKQLERWSRLNRGKKSNIATKSPEKENPTDQDLVPDKNDEYLIYQTLLGVWPFQTQFLSDEERADIKSRVTQYVIKAAREAKVHTSWLNCNATYEDALSKFIELLLSQEGGNAFLDDFLAFQQKIEFFGMLNSLSQTVIKLTVPGVPDIYQGTETWRFSLVDPDNRRPVDYDVLSAQFTLMQEHMASHFLPEDRLALLSQYFHHYANGDVKLFLTAVCTQYRKQHETLFSQGNYIPLEIDGPLSEHVIAFARQQGGQLLLTVAPRFMYSLFKNLMTKNDSENPTENQESNLDFSGAIWRENRLLLNNVLQGDKTFKNVLTNEMVTSENQSLPLETLLSGFPVALLVLE